MTLEMLPYVGLFLIGVFISAISQVLLKKSADQEHSSVVTQYLNPLVIVAYVIFVVATLLNVLAYTSIPLNLGPVLDSTSYIFVTAFGVLIFHERLNKKKVIALVLIVVGILLYALG